MVLDRAAAGWPRWAALALGVLSVLVGLVLLTRPFASLTVLILLVAAGFILSGVDDLADRREATDPQVPTVTGIAWIVAGVAVLVWPGLSLRVVAVVVGIALIVSGGSRVLTAIRGDTDQRAAAIMLGAASVVLGIVALAWPDVTILVVAVVFGVRLALFGLARIGDAIRGPQTDAAASPTRQGRLGRWAKTAGAAVALVLSLAILLVSTRLNEGGPTVDAFYTPPSDVPPQPGRLLRSEPFGRAIPAGAQVWRILYTSTRADGVPATASALVAAPAVLPQGPRPVIAWAHGTTGVDQTCAPSLLPTGIESGSPNAIDQVIAKGWVMVATDYIGLGTEGRHAYLVGEQAGRSVLDAIRAARQMPELSLSGQAVVWGHSQGGGAALWTGILAPTYAADANVIGVAALSPASNLPAFADLLDEFPGGAVFESFVAQGYTDTYPDVRFGEYVRPTAQIQAREIAGRCFGEPRSLVSVVQSLFFDKAIWARDPLTGPLGVRLQENVPSGPIDAPLLIGQGEADTIILPTAQAAYVQARCDTGYPVDYRTYPGDHITVVEPDSPLIPELIAWTQDRLDGRPAGSTC